jgi:phosphohistidine phosphatase SixA
MILYFLRHGLAGNPNDWQGDNRERPLIPKGKTHLELTAETLSRMDLHLGRISPVPSPELAKQPPSSPTSSK